ncbi:ATP synthase subunit 9 mitochondrial [Bienertia sinuspersici]
MGVLGWGSFMGFWWARTGAGLSGVGIGQGFMGFFSGLGQGVRLDRGGGARTGVKVQINGRRSCYNCSAGDAIGIGNVFSSSIHFVARNPSLAKQLFGYAILGFALTKAIALFALMMAFLISFVFRFFKEREVLKFSPLLSSGRRRVLDRGCRLVCRHGPNRMHELDHGRETGNKKASTQEIRTERLAVGSFLSITLLGQRGIRAQVEGAPFRPKVVIRLFGKEFARYGIIKCAESGDSTERIGMKWVIGNGRILNLLKDSWWIGKTLDKAIVAVPQEDLSKCKV